MSKKSRAKIDLNFLRPSPCTDKKWKSPISFQGNAQESIVSQQMSNYFNYVKHANEIVCPGFE